MASWYAKQTYNLNQVILFFFSWVCGWTKDGGIYINNNCPLFSFLLLRVSYRICSGCTTPLPCSYFNLYYKKNTHTHWLYYNYYYYQKTSIHVKVRFNFEFIFIKPYFVCFSFASVKNLMHAMFVAWWYMEYYIGFFLLGRFRHFSNFFLRV